MKGIHRPVVRQFDAEIFVESKLAVDAESIKARIYAVVCIKANQPQSGSRVNGSKRSGNQISSVRLNSTS